VWLLTKRRGRVNGSEAVGARGRPQSIAVATIGARRHYAVPVAAHRAGLLERFYTDLWTGDGWFGRGLRCAASRLSQQWLRKWAGRYEPSLPGAKVTAFTAFGAQYAWRLRRARTSTERTQTFLWAGDAFCRLVVRSGLGGAKAVYAVLGGAQGIFARARHSGIRCILDQMSCPHLFRQLRREELERWPGWETAADEDDAAVEADQWEATEQELADVIHCPSVFVRNYLISLGVPQAKTAVVPYAVDTNRFHCHRSPFRGNRPLRILFLGTVNLMKGVPYLLEALRMLDSSAVEARLVGPVLLNRQVLAPYRRYCRIMGPVSRSGVLEHYAWADVLVLPSLCEGSALVTYEAPAAGVAVIATPSAGSPLRHGVDGFLVPVRDVPALARSLERLASNPALLTDMSQNARQRAQEFSWDKYEERLVAVLSKPLAEDRRDV